MASKHKRVISCLSIFLMLTLCGLAVCVCLIVLQVLGETDIISYKQAAEKQEQTHANVRDYAESAKQILRPTVKRYLFAGATDVLTVRDNVCAYRKWVLQRRLLVNVNGYNTESFILGQKVAAPLGISPTAYHKLYHPDGEVGTAGAAEKAGITMVLSGYASQSLETVRGAARNLNLWQMTYIFADKNITLRYIRRAEAANCKAIVITVDSYVGSIKYYKKRWGSSDLYQEINVSANGGGYFREEMKKAQNPPDTPTWADLAWVVKQTRLPVVAKGIMSAQDAKKAVEAGVKGVFISNHGGRVLDGVSATVDVLEEVVGAVKGTGVEVYVDGGVKSGMDVFRALALGADAVFVGRAPLYGLAHSGQAGVADVLNILVSELKNTMGLVGVTSVANITSDMVRKRPDGYVVSCDSDMDLL